MLGKTIPKKVRGQLTGWSASAAGLLTIGVGFVLMTPVARLGETDLIGLLLVGAGLLWVFAAAIYSLVGEYPGETGGGAQRCRGTGKAETAPHRANRSAASS